MSVKSIKAKLYIPKGPEGDRIRKAIDFTHRIHNQGVRWFIEKLLLMRQEDVYEDRDSNKPSRRRSDLQEMLLKQAREAQKRNGGSTANSDATVLSVLRQTYERIIPASTGNPGGNQSIARDWLSSMVSRESRAGLGLSKGGRKPSWAKLAEDDPRRQELRNRCEARLRETHEKEIRPELKRLNLLPLWSICRFEFGSDWSRISARGQRLPFDSDEVTGWERDMFQQALERLSTWESWNRNAIDRCADKRKAVELWTQDHADSLAVSHPIFERYERARSAELRQGSLGLQETFRIMPRMLRGWDRLREKWFHAKKNGSAQTAGLIEILKGFQTKQSREIGDVHLFHFLAQPENQALWIGDYDHTLVHLKLNTLLDEMESSHPYTIMTLPDPLKHPLWKRFDVPEGTNMNDYRIQRNEDGSWTTTIALLFPDGERVIEQKIDLRLAPSGQLSTMRPVGRSAREVVYNDPGSLEEFKGQWGQVRLQLERELLEKNFDTGRRIPTYLNIALSLEDAPSIPAGVFKQRKDGEDWFIVGLRNSKHLVESAFAGFGCLSVDLGVRQAAACSVFRLSNGHGKDKTWAIPITGVPELLMEHERSFLIRLPGETPDRRIDQKRERLWDELQGLGRDVRILGHLARLAGVPTEERQQEFDALLLMATESRRIAVDQIKETLVDHLRTTSESWEKAVLALHRDLEKRLSEAIIGWRRGSARDEMGRSRQAGAWGVSLAGIEYLERARRILIRWTNHPRQAGEIKRLPKGRIFAARLLKHINRLKEDRLKKAADALLKAALGQPSTDGGPHYKPCRLILFEDLSRYRFRTDRPRHENSMLMRWAHRELVRETAKQAQLYGIRIGLVGAGFSSRYHAATLSPGLRCRALKAVDFQNEYVQKALQENGLALSGLRAGTVVPWPGGELFCALLDGKTNLTHADINAAQNLQVRFWTDYQEPFRVRCVPDSHGAWIPSVGQRNKAYFGSYTLQPVGASPDVCELAEASAAAAHAQTADESQFLETMNDGAVSEEDEATILRHQIFFRDPSGMILPSRRWYAQKLFWGQVKTAIEKRLIIR